MASKAKPNTQPKSEEVVADQVVKALLPEVPQEMFLDYLARYRKLKVEMDSLSQQMDALKPIIQRSVEAQGGKYQDDVGYARMITRNESVSYPGDQVEQLVRAWITSDNDIMKSCGQMLLPMRKTSKGYSYLQIK